MPAIAENAPRSYRAIVTKVLLGLVVVAVIAVVAYFLRYDAADAVGASPKAVTLQFTRDIQTGKYTDAYNLTSKSYRSTANANFLLTALATQLHSVWPKQGDPMVTQDLDRLHAIATTQATFVSGGKTYRTDLEFVRESGGWKIDSIRLK